MQHIPLTKGAYAIVDDESLALISPYRWRLNDKGYAVANTRRADGHRTVISMHRLVMGLSIGGPEVDHKNRDRLDNRRANLRICEFGGNQRNRGIPKSNKSGLKGVSWHRGAWVAQIKVNYRCLHLGRYPTKEEAHEVYCLWADMAHGDFANHGA